MGSSSDKFIVLYFVVPCVSFLGFIILLCAINQGYRMLYDIPFYQHPQGVVQLSQLSSMAVAGDDDGIIQISSFPQVPLRHCSVETIDVSQEEGEIRPEYATTTQDNRNSKLASV